MDGRARRGAGWNGGLGEEWGGVDGRVRRGVGRSGRES